MTIALICPSNILYMPYVNNYEALLKNKNVKYDIILWDRFSIEWTNKYYVYRDSKVGHNRNFADYMKYANFVNKHLDAMSYDKIIVFGIQLGFFFRNTLRTKYKGKYIIDVRDYNRIVKYFNVGKLIGNSAFTVLSSPKYVEWLPQCNKYFINHNAHINNINDLEERVPFSDKSQINIAYIGAIRDYKINIDLIKSILNSERIMLNYHGEGGINKALNCYLLENDVNNVCITGRYIKSDEEMLYKRNDMINVLRYNDGINNRTALPNRLYNAAIFGKPMLAYKGTYLANQIEKYNLGLIIDSFDDVEKKILNYFTYFSYGKYIKNREAFLSKIIEDNEFFAEKMFKFISQ